MIQCDAVRELCLALPDAEEHDHFGRPSFRVRGKIFATLWEDQSAAVLKMDREAQQELVRESPETFSSVPGTWGERGYTRVSLKSIESEDMAALLARAWSAVAPKRLVNAYLAGKAQNEML